MPVCMVGLLYALPGTQLTRRLEKEGRLHKGHDIMRVEQAGDQCTLGCNFDTKRPLRDILTDYKTVLANVFTPGGLCGAAARLAAMMDRSGRPKQLADGDIRKSHGVNVLYKIMQTLPEVREPFWKTFVEISKNNPDALRQIVTLMAIYLHLGPFSKHVIGEIDRRIASWTRLHRRPRPRSPPTARRWRRTRNPRLLVPARAGIHAPSSLALGTALAGSRRGGKTATLPPPPFRFID